MRYLAMPSKPVLFTAAALIAAGVIFGVIFWLTSRANDTTTFALLHTGKTIAENGRDGQPACVQCHGGNGEGNRAMGAPRLAGMPAGYLEKQLHDFARNPLKAGVTLDPIAHDYNKTPKIQVDLTALTPGVRRVDAMNAISATLNAQEVKAVAFYFSSLGYNFTAIPSDPETLARGEDLALRGKPEYGIPACASCHGADGKGYGNHFPPIAGQAPEYIVQQLNQWQTGARDNDQMALMRNIAEQLTDGDKINVAAYFANIAVSSTGGVSSP
ncbi:MAG: c-type cytochrome [Gammaproteobacteria bacterium]|nr:c-type cytochrome [Gammaproteobacteria bacterium]